PRIRGCRPRPHPGRARPRARAAARRQRASPVRPQRGRRRPQADLRAWRRSPCSLPFDSRRLTRRPHDSRRLLPSGRGADRPVWKTLLNTASMLLAHELVTRQARATPDRPAVEDERGVLTYAELDCWSDRIAYELIEEGFGEDAVVGLLSARGRGVAPRMLGILKAGSAYLPLDPDYPPERLAFMLR